MRIPAALLLLAALVPAQQDEAAEGVDSPWYLERGTHTRAAGPDDDIPEVAFALEALMRDGGVPGFYDGQFASTADRADELERLARDDRVHHVLRMMAVMALQEAAEGERLRAALEPLILSPLAEFDVEIRQLRERWRPSMDPDWIRRQLDAELSRYAHFALAKAGMAEHTLAKIEVMELRIRRNLDRILDASYESTWFEDIYEGRQLIFEIAYHYQQFDDYENASLWFERLTENLPGMTETRWAHYNLACMASLTGRLDDALEHLRAAYEVGFLDVAWMDEDGDLEAVRATPGYADLKREMLGR